MSLSLPIDTPSDRAARTAAVDLLALVFHRAHTGHLGNSPEMLDAVFAHVARDYHCVLPGEALRTDRLNVCLTFDDGTYDFVEVVRPLLEKHNLRALLAVSPGLILDRNSHSPFPSLETAGRRNPPRDTTSGLCTWPELRNLAVDGRVAFAAHGMTHACLDDPAEDLCREILESGDRLEEKLGVPVTSFVFPYGRHSPEAVQVARNRYRYIFRIGQASNTGWNQPLLHRISADNLVDPAQLFSPARLRAYRSRGWWNRLLRR